MNKIKFSHKAKSKMLALIKITNKEVAWHGLVTANKNLTSFFIYDILVFPQDVTHATTIATDDVAEWYNNLSDKALNNLRMHGHSHVNMDVTPSPTDMSYYNKVAKQIKDYYIFMIINKQHNIEVILYKNKDNSTTYYTDNALKLEFANPIKNWAKRQLKRYTYE